MSYISNLNLIEMELGRYCKTKVRRGLKKRVKNVLDE